MLYFAYGSNLNIAAMARRCPAAVPLEKFWLADSRLVFRGVADCIYEPGAKCPGALWKITAECEQALDRYEGIGSGMYRKEYCELRGFEGEPELMLYVMNSTGIFPPSRGYFHVIVEGYRDFGLPLKPLRAALKASYDDKAPSHVERRRYARDGRPVLAKLRRPAPQPTVENSGPPTTGNLFGFQEESV